MKDELVGLIPAAGKGARLHPKSKNMPKALIEVDGRPLLLRNIELMRDSLKIKRIIIIVGYNKEQIIDRFKDGAQFGVSIDYIYNRQVERGLADGILLAEDRVANNFCVILGDELYEDSNHQELLDFLKKDFIAVCGIKRVRDPYLITKNYAVEIADGEIKNLIEKPHNIRNDYLGCGTYIFNRRIFDFIRATPISKKTDRQEIIDVIDLAAKECGKIYPFFLKGEYVNINNMDDLSYANYLLRRKNFTSRKISLIIPAYNEEESIGYVIDNFKNDVAEIIVVNNNSLDNTAKIAKNGGAVVYTGSFRGYGDALKFGMDKASGDILILTEADGSFRAQDIGKILEYLKDADMVIGTRTTRQMIQQAANMNGLLRWGNVAVAKLIEILWWARQQPRFTDVGCTFRGIWKDVYLRIRDNLQAKGPEFSPEMMIELMNFNMRVIEIPVTYYARMGGASKLSNSLFAAVRNGLHMIILILYKKIKTLSFLK